MDLDEFFDKKFVVKPPPYIWSDVSGEPAGTTGTSATITSPTSTEKTTAISLVSGGPNPKEAEPSQTDLPSYVPKPGVDLDVFFARNFVVKPTPEKAALKTDDVRKLEMRLIDEGGRKKLDAFYREMGFNDDDRAVKLYNYIELLKATDPKWPI